MEFILTDRADVSLPYISTKKLLDPKTDTLVECLNESLSFLSTYWTNMFRLIMSGTTEITTYGCAEHAKGTATSRIVAQNGIAIMGSTVCVQSDRIKRESVWRNCGPTWTHELTHAAQYESGEMLNMYIPTSSELDLLEGLGVRYDIASPDYPRRALRASGKWQEAIARAFEILHYAYKDGELARVEARFRREAPGLWAAMIRLGRHSRPVEWYDPLTIPRCKAG